MKPCPRAIHVLARNPTAVIYRRDLKADLIQRVSFAKRPRRELVRQLARPRSRLIGDL
jgi:hypothetical protein